MACRQREAKAVAEAKTVAKARALAEAKAVTAALLRHRYFVKKEAKAPVAEAKAVEEAKLSFLAARLVSHHKRVSLLRHILSFLSFHETKNAKDYIELRSFSKLFHRALPQPPPLWTSFPNSNHETLQSLVDRLEELQGDEESSGNNNNVPSVLFIDKGVYGAERLTRLKRCTDRLTGTDRWYRDKLLLLNIPLSIYGAGRRKTKLVGVGLKIQGNKSNGIVEIENLKIKGGQGDAGLYADGGMNVMMRGVSIVECRKNGVYAYAANISCDDLQVADCGSSGVCAVDSATIKLRGEGTCIRGNGEKAARYITYGLYALSPASKIQLVAPLTKEQISIYNSIEDRHMLNRHHQQHQKRKWESEREKREREKRERGERPRRNWGGSGTIEQVSK